MSPKNVEIGGAALFVSLRTHRIGGAPVGSATEVIDNLQGGIAMQWLQNDSRRKPMLATAICAVAMMGIGSGTALAGEVTGNGKPTAGPEHANSICTFSGQNDFENGQTIFHVQSPGQEHRLGFTPPGVPGEACKGFSNPDNPREKKGP